MDVAVVAVRPANLAVRAVAVLLDALLAFFVLGELIALVSGQTGGPHGGHGFHLHGSPALILLIVMFLYWVVCEALFGATLFKRVFGIRVIGADGRNPSWPASFMRNILRVVDGFPYVLPYLVGFVAAIANGERRRLGDLAAGTRVVGR